MQTEEPKKDNFLRFILGTILILTLSSLFLAWHFQEESPLSSVDLPQEQVFILSKNQTLFNLTSKYDGVGMGIMFSSLTEKINKTLYISSESPEFQPFLLGVNIEPLYTRNVTQALHIKKIKPLFEEEERHGRALETYELLTTINNALFSFFFAIPKTSVYNSTSTGVWMNVSGTMDGYFIPTLMEEDEYFYYYTIKTNMLGLMAVVDNRES